MKTKIGLLTACVLLAITAVLTFPGIFGAVRTKAQATSCSLNFAANVRVGPDAGTSVGGVLAFQIGQGGDLTGTLATADNKTIAMVGQLTGRAISVGFEVQKPAATTTAATASPTATGQYILGSGTLWTPVSSSQPCGDNMGGTFSGPQDGDIGDWIGYVCGNPTSGYIQNPCVKTQKGK